MNVSHLSTEYVTVPVSVSDGADPTGDTVQFAFLPYDVMPAGGDWHVGAWETVDSAYFARCLVGPMAVVLAAGTYYVWLKITDSPEVPVKIAGTVTVT